MSVPLGFHPLVQIADVVPQRLAIRRLVHPVDAHRRSLADAPVGARQRVFIEKMRQRTKPLLRVTLRSTRYLRESR